MSPRAAVASQVLRDPSRLVWTDFSAPSGGEERSIFLREGLKSSGREAEERYMTTQTLSTLSNIDRIGGAIMDSLDRAGLLVLVGLVAWVITTSLLA